MLGQAASDAVIVTVFRPLTWANAVTWPVWPVAHSVRIAVLVGSGLRGPCERGRRARSAQVLLRRMAGNTARHGPACRIRRGGVLIEGAATTNGEGDIQDATLAR